MKEVFIISSGDIVTGKIAGTQRVINIAKSLASGNIDVHLCSLAHIKNNNIESIELLPHVNFFKSKKTDKSNSFGLLGFIRCLDRIITQSNSTHAIYLYPTTFVFKDFIYLLYFKVLKRHRFFCDINEVRSTNVFVTTPPQGLMPKIYYYLKNLITYLVFKLSELQIPLYDGIVVISTNLERYFAHLSKKIIRVPILCDTANINETRYPIRYDGAIFKICFAGYINCVKEGFDIVFEALYHVNQIRNVELYLYGTLSENDSQKINHLTNTFILHEKIFYMGNINPANLLNEFTKYHLLIIPRPLNPQTKYGFSTKLSEYLVSGVPVLVTDVSDNSIYIKDKYNGYIISPGSMKGLEDKILEIIDNHNAESSVISHNAMRTAVDMFDYKRFTNTLIDLIFKC